MQINQRTLKDEQGHAETAGNKLFDITTLLYKAEQQPLSADEWLRLSRVIRHALEGVGESLCQECTYGDLVPTDARINTLQRSIRMLEKKAHRS